jgi:hypothetical protein
MNYQNLEFNQFLKRKYQVNDLQYIHVFMPQVKHVIMNKQININFIGRFENLENDFQTILRRIGFKRILHNPIIKINSRPHKDYRTYYTQETLDIVNILFKNDFIRFKYDICNDLAELNKDVN